MRIRKRGYRKSLAGEENSALLQMSRYGVCHTLDRRSNNHKKMLTLSRKREDISGKTRAHQLPEAATLLQQ